MTEANRLTPFAFTQLPIRGRILRLNDLHLHVPSLAHAPVHLRHTLAEMLTTAALIAADGKKSGLSATLQVQHPELGILLFAHCGADGTLKAYGNPAASDIPFDAISKHPGQPGIFAITLEPEQYEGTAVPRSQSLIPLTHASVSKCVESYFAEAVQTPTHLRVFSGNVAEGNSVHCGAVFLQKLPEAPRHYHPETGDEQHDDDWTRMSLLLNTLQPEEILPCGPAAETLIGRLFAEDDVSVFPAESLTFQQDNPRPRMYAALASLPVAELKTLLEEGPIVLTDETSGRTEAFTEEDLAEILV